MSRLPGQIGKPTLLNDELQKRGLTTEAFHEKMKEVLLNMPDLPGEVALYPAFPLNYIRLLKSGKKPIVQCSVATILKLCYTLDCTPNDLIPNLKEGEKAPWKRVSINSI